MNPGWAVRLPIAKASSVANLRLRANILLTQIDDAVWLRGQDITDELMLELRKLPGGEHFNVSDDETLTRKGARVPAGKLPDTKWQPLSTWISPQPQPAALPGQLRRRAALRLIRAVNESPASALLVDFSDWLAFAIGAPMVRLNALTFAVNQNGRTLIRGEPLPPLKGIRHVDRDGIVIPCGYAHSPAIDSQTVKELLGTNPTDVALFAMDGSVEVIAGGKFIRATRSAVRATAETFVPNRSDTPNGIGNPNQSGSSSSASLDQSS